MSCCNGWGLLIDKGWDSGGSRSSFSKAVGLKDVILNGSCFRDSPALKHSDVLLTQLVNLFVKFRVFFSQTLIYCQ